MVRNLFVSVMQVMGACLLLVGTSAVDGQAADSTPTDPRVVEAQRKQAIAEAEKATAEAERDAYKAKIGEISADRLPKGTINAEKIEIEGKLLAYRAAEKVIDDIVKAVVAVDPKKVVFHSSKELNSLIAYKAFTGQATLLLSRIGPISSLPPLLTDNLQKPCVPPVTLKAVPPLLAIDAALQLLALLKVDRTLAGQNISIDEFALYALIAGKLKIANVAVAYPPSFYPNVLTPSAPSPSIYAIFQNLSKSQFTLLEFSSRIDAKRVELSTRAEAEKDKACKELYKIDLEVLNERQSRVKELQSVIERMVAGLIKPDDQTGLSLVQTLATAEQLATNFASAYILQVKPIVAGGTSQTRTNIFGSQISFSGGVVISYMLYDNSGSISTAGTIPLYGGFVELKGMK